MGQGTMAQDSTGWDRTLHQIMMSDNTMTTNYGVRYHSFVSEWRQMLYLIPSILSQHDLYLACTSFSPEPYLILNTSLHKERYKINYIATNAYLKIDISTPNDKLY